MNQIEKVFGTWTEPFRRWGMFKNFPELITEINKLYKEQTIYPEKKNIFRVFRETPYDKLKVVMLFQDPYHDGSATGIAAANEKGNDEKLSPTLQILAEERYEDLEGRSHIDPTLLNWSEQGVLLLNTALTVRAGEPGSHLHLWRPWTEKLITSMSMDNPKLVYILLGRKAQEWNTCIIDGSLIYAPHPAAETYAKGRAGFYGSRIFTKANKQLEDLKINRINW